jgi:hypothetical protein
VRKKTKEKKTKQFPFLFLHGFIGFYTLYVYTLKVMPFRYFGFDQQKSPKKTQSFWDLFFKSLAPK